jgi:hypothetical protein
VKVLTSPTLDTIKSEATRGSILVFHDYLLDEVDAAQKVGTDLDWYVTGIERTFTVESIIADGNYALALFIKE